VSLGGLTGSRRIRRRITWLIALGAVAGAIAVLVAVLPDHGGSTTVAPAVDSPRQGPGPLARERAPAARQRGAPARAV